MLIRNISAADKKKTAARLVKVSQNFKYDKAHQLDGIPVDSIINDIEKYPHLFVLACLMDKQIKADRAWRIPAFVCEKLCHGDYRMEGLLKLSLEDLTKFFNDESLHRFNNTMATVFYNAIQRIHRVYNDDASEIWNGKNTSALVIGRFLEFEGAGIKIASMATNLLHRIFNVAYTDYSSLDVSPDVQVKRVLYRLGLIEQTDNNDIVIYTARDINPNYPGIIDKCCWNVGRDYCHPSNPNCGKCPLIKICESNKTHNYSLPTK